MQLANRTFFITGGSSGLGAATVSLFAKHQANIVIVDLNVDEGKILANQIGAQALFINTDVTNENDVNKALSQTLSTFGQLDGVVNCAGILGTEKILNKSGAHSFESFKRTVSINLFGTFNVMRLAAEIMSKNTPSLSKEQGVIINTSSIAASEGQIGQSAYSASKAAINGLTLPAARELAKFGIRVVSIAPGIFDTPMMKNLSEEVRQSLGAQIPFPSRLGNPPEFAELAKHIIENELLNGTVIRLDGAIRMGPN